MNKCQTVKVTWGMFKGEEGTITEINGKNVTVMLTSKGYETQLSVDHIELANKAKILKTVKVSELKKGDMFKRFDDNSTLYKIISVTPTGKESMKIIREDGINPTTGKMRTWSKTLHKDTIVYIEV